MTRRPTAARLHRLEALALGFLALLAAGAALGSAVLAKDVSVAGYNPPQTYEVVSIGVFLFVSPLLGAVLATRLPANPIGWLFIAVPAVLAVGLASDSYSMWARHVAADQSPLPDILAVVGGAIAGLGFGGIALIALLFPSGRLLSARWRIALWLVVAGQVGFVAGALRADNVKPGLRNVLAIPSIDPALEVLEFVAVITTIGAIAGGALALGLRYRRAKGAERQQVKWFAFAGALTTGLLVLATVAPEPIVDGFWIAALSSLALWPVAAAIAILRYRLYDIDLLINRTIVYTGLTAALGTIFFAGLVFLQRLLSPITGASELGVALSTLGSFTLFQPLRRRIQGIVDRRFNRQKYDATRTLDGFTSRLGDEIDIDALRGDLLAVVGTTMAPVHVSLWLRDRA